MSARRPFRPPARLGSATQPAAAGAAATAGAALPLQAIFDCLFMRGKKAAQEGSLVLAGRTAAVFDLQLREVAGERLPAAVAEALRVAYTAATASDQVQDAPLRGESFSLAVGAVRLEIENKATAAVTAAEWALRQRVQQQVAQQAKKRKAEPDAPPLPADSIGARLLSKMGWEVGSGLGKEGQGRALPILPTARPGKMGLGGVENMRLLGAHTTRFRRATSAPEH